MSFGFMNANAKYKGLIDTLFANLIGKNLEVYINNMVIK